MKINDEKYSFYDVTRLTNEALVELYTLFVKVEHYDPHETPEQYVCWSRYINKFQIETEILGRMRVR